MCDADQLARLISSVIPVPSAQITCQEPKQFDTLAYIALYLAIFPGCLHYNCSLKDLKKNCYFMQHHSAVYGSLIGLVVLGTLCDIYVRNKTIFRRASQVRCNAHNPLYDDDPSSPPKSDVNSSTDVKSMSSLLHKGKIVCDSNYKANCFLVHLDDNDSKHQPLVLRLLLCFSIYTNTVKLLTVTKSDDQFQCLHGIRFLSLSWWVTT